MKQIAKWQASDGSEWVLPEDAAKREDLLAAIADAMAPLGAERRIRDGQYVQHDPETVLGCRVAILRLAAKQFPGESIFRHEPPEEVHPFSIAGRILDDCGGPLNRAWGRFMRIDDQGREWEQPYFTTNPPADAVAI